jgi:hypothetical protein
MENRHKVTKKIKNKDWIYNILNVFFLLPFLVNLVPWWFKGFFLCFW